MSLDEIQENMEKKEQKTCSKADKEAAKKARLLHMKNILSAKQNAGLVLSEAERARLLLLKDMN